MTQEPKFKIGQDVRVPMDENDENSVDTGVIVARQFVTKREELDRATHDVVATEPNTWQYTVMFQIHLFDYIFHWYDESEIEVT